MLHRCYCAGIILLQLLCGRAPLLRDKDDLPALAHIAIMCGLKPLQDLASTMKRCFK
jgi:hypothetical protein